MDAIRLVEVGRPLVHSEVANPTPGSGQLLVRVSAVGICHSDAHYRSGESPTGPLPLTFGHEVAGVVQQVGDGAENHSVGDRVALHYLLSCGQCDFCRRELGQFCAAGKMLGKHCDGGYAQYVCIPAQNAVAVPDTVAMEEAAIMMCSAATSLHALDKARLATGESVAIFGVGGLGMSAIQLAAIMGASRVFAVDTDSARLEIAQLLGATPIDATDSDPVEAIRSMTNDRGVDVAVELIGLPVTMQQAVGSLDVLGRAALVGLTQEAISIFPYTQLINREAEVVGVCDHLASDLPRLMAWAADGKLDFSRVVTERIPLDAEAINGVLDRLDQFGSGIRAVIVP